MDKRIDKIISLIQREITYDFSLNDLAEISGLSTYHFLRLFKNNVGITPMKYLKLLRLEQAKNLLELTSLNIKEICYKVGLNDLSHFVRDFKLRYGFYPTVYRLYLKKQLTN